MANLQTAGEAMSEDRFIELEIKQAYQEDLIQALNQVVAKQQMQIGKLEETCKLLHDKIKSLALDDRQVGAGDERPPHY
jgi:SlyX protein